MGGKECFSRMMELDMKLLAADIEEIKLRMVDAPIISREDCSELIFSRLYCINEFFNSKEIRMVSEVQLENP